MRVFEHCAACTAPFGGGTVTRSMRRLANAMLLRFDRYDEPPDSTRAQRDARSEHGYLTTDACEWPQCGCLSTVRLAPRHVVVEQ
jgi:hypothetical protein